MFIHIRQHPVVRRLLFAACLVLCGCIARSEPAAPANGGEQTGSTWRIANEVMSVGVSARDAGAVCSLVYDGKELVNDLDHGRQLQVAWCYNDLDEAYNPTEAGSERDGRGPRSTSRLTFLKAEGAALETRCHPAYWRDPAMPERFRKNTALATNDLLTKTVKLGHNGDPNVLVFDATVAVSTELSGPPITSLRIEAPTFYASADLSRHCLFDPASEQLKEAPALARNKDRMNEVIRRAGRADSTIPVLASPDDRYAAAVFAPRTPEFWGYFTHAVPSDNPAAACGKITAFFKHGATAGRTYSYRTFVVVGSLATVKASLRKLLAAQPDAQTAVKPADLK